MTAVIGWDTDTLVEAGGELIQQSASHALQFDCVVNESHNATAVVTEHAVEDGAAITDHKRPDPRRLTLEGLVTNHPMGDVPPSGYTTEAPPSADRTEGVVKFSRSFDRVGDVFATLQRLVAEPTLVTVTTALETYENMAVISVSLPREPARSSSGRFTVELQQVRIARTSLVDSPIPREPRGGRPQDAGTQEGEENAEEETEELEDTRSTLAQLVDDPEGFLSGVAEGFGLQ